MSKQIQLYGEAAQIAAIAMMEDSIACGCNGARGPVAHSRDRLVNGVYIAYQCDSRSRSYNPATGRVEGRAHCTCDYCF